MWTLEKNYNKYLTATYFHSILRFLASTRIVCGMKCLGKGSEESFFVVVFNNKKTLLYSGTMGKHTHNYFACWSPEGYVQLGISDSLWGRIHGFRWCINPRRTRGSQLGREKQRHESVKALRNVRESFVLPLVLQNFRRAFPASLGLPRPQGRRHIGKREDLGEEVVRTEKTKPSILL